MRDVIVKPISGFAARGNLKTSVYELAPEIGAIAYRGTNPGGHCPDVRDTVAVHDLKEPTPVAIVVAARFGHHCERSHRLRRLAVAPWLHR